MWPPNRDALTRPAYLSLARSLAQAIDEGSVQPGTQLPTHRALAFDMGLSVQTVSRAYQELARLGVIAGAVGRGSFVLPPKTDAHVPWQRGTSEEEMLDCSLLVPVAGALHALRMSEALAALSQNLPPTALHAFRPRQALSDHAALARDWLEGCGVPLESRTRILPTNGNTSAMTCALMTATTPGDLVLAGEMGHHTMMSLVTVLGLRLSGLPMDAEGILPDAFDRACAARRVKAIFLMPAGLGPTACVMGAKRRAAIATVARKHDVWIIEDDAWGPLDPHRAPPIAAIAPERTFYFTGLSKCLLAGLRIAWLVVPEAKVHAARTRHLVTNWMATPLIAEIANRWIKDGTAHELLAFQRNALMRRNRIASRAFAGIAHVGTPYGLHVWLPLPEAWDDGTFVALARDNGVAVAAGSHFAIDDAPAQTGVRVSLGAGSEADLEDGLTVLARLIRTTPERSSPVF